MSAGPTIDEVRGRVRAWLDEHWDPDLPLREWRDLLADSGWGCPAWPVDAYGQGLPADAAAVVAEELRRAGAVGPAAGSGMSLAAPTILAHGSPDLRRRLLRPILTGEHTWCQLFSEPGNGSDLAGLTTRAVPDGDEFVVNGQKVWTTNAHRAAFGMLLARTDWDAPKHRGITWFAFPMDQPGVEVRPLRQMNGHASFNEVFLTDARVSTELVVGDVNGGWAAALTTLAHERGLAPARWASVPAGEDAGAGRCVREAAAEAAEYARTYVWYPQRAGRADLVVERARARTRRDRPSPDAPAPASTSAAAPLPDHTVLRQQVAGLEGLVRASRWMAERHRSERAAGTRPPGAEGSLAKLAASEIARRSNAAHSRIAGAEGMLAAESAPTPTAAVVAEVLISTPGASIAGGTDEIQRNIVGERLLDLPREPSVDTGIPFRDVRTNAPHARG